MQVLDAARPTCRGHPSRMPDGSTVKQMLFTGELSRAAGRLWSSWLDRGSAALRPTPACLWLARP
eukprot:365511-Chlamydomonas_euryale.AAC.4